ncbi:hypothetical protein AHAS_Ahas05G0103800 [Arachis hypogaea]
MLDFFFKSTYLCLTAFANYDWVSDLEDRKSTSGYCMYYGSNLISWKSHIFTEAKF